MSGLGAPPSQTAGRRPNPSFSPFAGNSLCVFVPIGWASASLGPPPRSRVTGEPLTMHPPVYQPHHPGTEVTSSERPDVHGQRTWASAGSGSQPQRRRRTDEGPPAPPGTVFTGQRRRANGPTLSHVSSVLPLPTDGHAITYGPWTHACSARRHDGVSVTVSPESRRTATARLSEYSSSDKGTEIDSRYQAAPRPALFSLRLPPTRLGVRGGRASSEGIRHA